LDSCVENISVKLNDHSKTIKRVISPMMNSSGGGGGGGGGGSSGGGGGGNHMPTLLPFCSYIY
jgi:uncharacterized membrane protein